MNGEILKAQHFNERWQWKLGLNGMNMTSKITLTPKEKEVHTLSARGKTPDMIAIRLNMKVSKVLTMLSMMPKAVV